MSVEMEIIAALRRADEGVQLDTLAGELGLTRHTVAKYLEVLRAKGRVTYRQAGRTKLWKEFSDQALIRDLLPSDVEALLGIEARIESGSGSGPDESRRRYLEMTARHHITQGDPCLGAELDGRLIGFIIGEARAWEFGRAEPISWIKVLGVDPEWQAHGIGRRLGEALLARFKQSGVSRVRTLVDWYQGDLISYFKSLGFDILNMIPLEKSL